MRKVLVAFDGSDNSKRALQYVVDFAREYSAELEVHVLNVQYYEGGMYGEYFTANIIENLNSGLLAKAKSVLQQASDVLAAASIKHETHAVFGNVAEQVNDAVKRLGCDTVVMGTRGLGSFSGMLLGSATTRVIHEVSVPVVLVK
ncbi:universal stress protein [Stutzerimonas kirkiae]|uniref:Universal stress protein n=1 Tax=Stutzerimonas kirkiae TaxID=2211392 RepID=A0A4Q9RE27_9GAMM|nr:universal stress protein [Stutzerimonas kirkiae]TBU99830.1 universal stress protein [Stutzerimonas kirkiae]TBV05238.1 universal stress protein [Stutzerimonas kirkiae]TBV08139.1 universal stress protein [Stutzerimonas kirkiae]TBV17596.1 universal stress protein [Stutzerimonas kirkiae]